jgi:hypothetical protein
MSDFQRKNENEDGETTSLIEIGLQHEDGKHLAVPIVVMVIVCVCLLVLLTMLMLWPVPMHTLE